MARRPSNRRRPVDVDAEINLLPVLNLMVGLIPIILLMASFVHLAVIDSSLPKIDQMPPPDQTPPPEIPLVLTVELFDTGIKATCTGGITREELKKLERGKSTCGDNVIAKVDGDYDWVAFSKKIVEIKDAHPNDQSVILRPVDGVIYDDIVKAMDYTRVCHKDVEEELGKNGCLEESSTKMQRMTRKLFPNVNMAFSAEEAGGMIQ